MKKVAIEEVQVIYSDPIPVFEDEIGQEIQQSQELNTCPAQGFGTKPMNNLTTQREFIIKKLQNAGSRGVSSYEFTFEYRIKQCPTRVYELRKLGFNIISKPYKNSVIYVLDRNPKTVENQSTPKPQQWQLDQMAMDRQVKVEKNGKVYWEDVREPEQMSI